ncbi:MAG: extracellular solute-binding protein [Bdellovibrionales bacterium]
MKKYILICLLSSFCLPLLANELVIYSARKEFLIKPLVAAFQKETGIKTSYITGKAAPLVEKIKAEKEKTKADLLMTVDAGNLWQAAELGILTPMKNSKAIQSVESYFLDPNKNWVALSIRARSIFYNPKLVNKSDLSTYEDLANSKFQGKLCLRTSKKVYNQSLVAMMIHHNGEAKTKKTVESWVNNLGSPVFSSDTKLLEAIDSGRCAIGIANTYYYGRLVSKAKASNVKIFWPNQKTTGAHINISGVGIVKHSKNKANAQRFIDWSLGKTAQEILAGLNFEYPVNPKIKTSKIVSSWGPFKRDQTNLSKAGQLQATSVKLMGSANYK